MSTAAPTQTCWVAAVVRDEVGRILLVRGADPIWDLPFAAMQLGEDPVTAVRRAVGESVTGGVRVEWMAGMHAHVRDGLTLVFLARHVSGRMATVDGASRCEWVSLDTAVQRLWPRRAEQLLGAVRSASPQPVIVVQQQRVRELGGASAPLPVVSDLEAARGARRLGVRGLRPSGG